MEFIYNFMKSDLGVAIAWLCTVGSTIFSILKQNENKRLKVEIAQKNNEVGGSMAGGHIKDNNQTTNTKRDTTNIEQSGNFVSGDLAGGNIIKNKE